MYINAGYLNNSRTDFKDNSTPLVVGSCGTYRLKTRPKLPTYWQKGRRDYQILYVANGKTHFWFDGKEEIVSAGHMVLYKPEEIQKYVYYLEDNPEVFWIHFTGSDVKNILEYHGISLDEHVFYCGVLPDYKALFRKIIQELQLCRYGYEDYIASLFNDILLLVNRQQHEQKKTTGNVQEQIERAAAYFNENYNKDQHRRLCGIPAHQHQLVYTQFQTVRRYVTGPVHPLLAHGQRPKPVGADDLQHQGNFRNRRV